MTSLVENFEEFRRRMTPVDVEVNWDIVYNCGVIQKLEELGFTFAAVKDLFTKRTPYKFASVSMHSPNVEVDGKKFEGDSTPADPIISYSIFPDGEVIFRHRVHILEKKWVSYNRNKHKLGRDTMSTEWVIRTIYDIYLHAVHVIDVIREANDMQVNNDLKDAMDDLW